MKTRMQPKKLVVCDLCGSEMKPRVVGDDVGTQWAELTSKGIDAHHWNHAKNNTNQIIWVCEKGCTLAK
jgi:predicted metal-binding protein